MTTFLAVYCLLLAVVLVAYVGVRYLNGQDDLCSLRNVALLGFIVFQLTSAVIHLLQDNFKPYRISDPEGAAMIYVAWATIFAVLALFSYRLGWGAKWMASKVPVSKAVPGDSSLLVMAGVLAVLGLVIRIGGQLPIVGALTDGLGTGYAAMAAGLCGWVWSKRFLNPLVIVYTGVITMAGFVTVMYSSFGRRGLVAVAAGLLWGMYYGSLRKEKPLVVLTRLGLVAILPLIFIALYTSVRQSSQHNRTAGQHLSAMASGGDLKNGLVWLFEGQNVASEGFWIIENYPESFDTRWFFTIRYTFEVTIPRTIYPGKPDPLSTKIAGQANIPKVDPSKLKLSPGILGSAAAEGGIWAVAVYAVLAGLFLRFYDQICILNPHSPFVVLPIASAMGQVLGFARGETSVMVNAFVLATLGCWATMLVVGRFVESIAGSASPPPDQPLDEDVAPDEDPYAEWQDYGAEAEPAAAR